MIIIVENATDRVKYAFPDIDAFTLDENGLRWSGGRDLGLSSSNATATEVDTLPAHFQGDVWAWRNDAFEVDDQNAYGALLETTKAELFEKLEVIRELYKTGGTVSPTYGKLSTSQKSQANITGANLRVDRDPTFTEPNWKIENGVYVSVGAAEIIAIGDLLTSHIQACFSRERALSDEITAAVDLDALTAIDLNAGWPDNGV